MNDGPVLQIDFWMLLGFWIRTWFFLSCLWHFRAAFKSPATGKVWPQKLFLEENTDDSNSWRGAYLQERETVIDLWLWFCALRDKSLYVLSIPQVIRCWCRSHQCDVKTWNVELKVDWMDCPLAFKILCTRKGFKGLKMLLTYSQSGAACPFTVFI